MVKERLGEDERLQRASRRLEGVTGWPKQIEGIALEDLQKALAIERKYNESRFGTSNPPTGGWEEAGNIVAPEFPILEN